MVIYDIISLLQEHARVADKYCMYISWLGCNDPTELVKAAPYMKDEEDILYILSETVLVFDTAEEAYSHYNVTVGANGPTEYNDYDGPARIYALMCSNIGEIIKENNN